MRTSFLFNVSHNDDAALKQFGEDKKLADNLRSIYVGENLTFPDTFKANQFVRVHAPEDTAVGDLESVVVPAGLKVDIKDPGL